MNTNTASFNFTGAKVLFQSSSRASFITGEALIVYGEHLFNS